MTKQIWHKGPPPHIGWWRIRTKVPYSKKQPWRWWDGECWSWPAFEDDTKKTAALMAMIKSEVMGIQWNTYWPKNARVPRIKP